MDVNPLQRRIVAADIAPERLAGNPRLSQDQKVAEASRQFESVLLKQILGDSQKTVIPSEFSDDSTAAGIYQDLVSKTLADEISKSGSFGLAKTFTQQLNRRTHDSTKASPVSAPIPGATPARSPNHQASPAEAPAKGHRLPSMPIVQP